MNGRPGESEKGGADTLVRRIAEINNKVARALSRSDDPHREVGLIAVSKTFPVEKIRDAIDAGLPSFGENRVQEIVPKYEELKGQKIEWHFIGHLQTNKVKKLLEVPTKYIHSLDRLELAEELERQLQKRGELREVLIEVNTSAEASKSGVVPEEAMELIRKVSRLSSIRIKGLMTIGALTEDNEIVRRCFRQLRDISLQVRDESIDGVEMSELSMGMSGDFEIAVEEGATIIRVGTAIFGDRYSPVL